MATVPVVLGAAYCVGDPAEEVLAAQPTPLVVRRAVRVALVLPALAAAWAVLLELVTTAPAMVAAPVEHRLPAGALTVQATALLAVALAAAAVAARGRQGGSAASAALAAPPAVLGLLVAGLLLPVQAQLYATPADGPLWPAAQRHWAVLLAGAVAVLLWASRDPWRRLHF